MMIFGRNANTAPIPNSTPSSSKLLHQTTGIIPRNHSANASTPTVIHSCGYAPNVKVHSNTPYSTKSNTGKPIHLLVNTLSILSATECPESCFAWVSVSSNAPCTKPRRACAITSLAVLPYSYSSRALCSAATRISSSLCGNNANISSGRSNIRTAI